MSIGDHFCMQLLQVILPPGTNIPESYGNGSDEDQVLPWIILFITLCSWRSSDF